MRCPTQLATLDRSDADQNVPDQNILHQDLEIPSDWENTLELLTPGLEILSGLPHRAFDPHDRTSLA
ncbi:MAG: hypothetical protein VX739_07625, partial [Planctomycetota bacterium]|nr:hypothetical protein [Planctomycetota bacterium]